MKPQNEHQHNHKYSNVILEGKGKAVVMVHGTMMDRTMFAPQIQAIKDGYCAIAYDQRARTPAYNTPYYLKDLADDCRSLLDDLGIEKCVLLGMSMGGYMATEFIRHFSDRVEALVMVGSKLGSYSQEEQELYMKEFHKFDYDGFVSQELAREAASFILGSYTLKNNPVLVSDTLQSWTKLPAKSVLSEVQSWIGKDDYTTTARNFGKPVLVIHGEDDQAIPVEKATNVMEKAFPNVEIVRIPNAGHTVNLEAPERTNEVLRSFLDSL
ncbi:alpha/beta fold hydrolase [Xenorhabdus hominickii]|uniref:Hydrolase n=1 Tax=Xenorhabdus hominickii TaxID=351679 RepID=A0A2G0Q3C3_XENHO|nr:alpha/beta hydrolase [Xenorhabdus hominickii]AOM39912.1 hypothetical protein A9255_04575 [Xenorhabdus hominickii]PHM53700.1 hydrolase [Xenorhabdus hominickii]